MSNPRSRFRRVPQWVRDLRPGCLRAYLAIVFLGPTRQDRRESSYW